MDRIMKQMAAYERYGPVKQIIFSLIILILNFYFYYAEIFNGIITFVIYSLVIWNLWYIIKNFNYRTIQIHTSEKELIEYLKEKNIDTDNLAIEEFKYSAENTYVCVITHKTSEVYKLFIDTKER